MIFMRNATLATFNERKVYSFCVGITNTLLHISKETENYPLSGGIQQDESDQQLHCGKPDQWSNISLEQKVSDQWQP